MIVAEDVARRIRDELAGLSDVGLRNRIASLVVEPKPVMRGWDYGRPGEEYLCWTVLEHPGTGVGVAYCEQGFGPRAPWGLVRFSKSPPDSIGQDSGWFSTFLDAVNDAMFIDELRS